ncbi:CvpA family protein [Clostridium thermobutyricum]|uniref:CvpA family protein n=1 Tax=Clostridium thermobutyricum TaxID=29372 RepID=UPI0018AC7B66|nr:CvpA family protein [Clostridium thermobutyricum]
MRNQKLKIEEFIEELANSKGKEIVSKLNYFNRSFKDDKIIEYSYIVEKVYSLSEDKVEGLSEKIDILKREGLKKNKYEMCENLQKILENIKLDLARRKETKSNEQKMHRFEVTLKKYEQEKEEFSKKVNQSEGNIEKTQAQIITILSIFAGIIIAFFGGTSLLGHAIENFNESNKFMSYVLVIIIGLVMFNVIYLLLYSISKLVKTPISMGRCSKKCNKCQNKSPLRRMTIKYPIVVYFNVSAVWAIFLISYLYVMIKSKTGFIVNHPIEYSYPIYFLVGVVILIIIIGGISSWAERNLECKKDIVNNQENENGINLDRVDMSNFNIIQKEVAIDEEIKKES